MSRRPAARVPEEPISEELLANIPVVTTPETTTFEIQQEEEVTPDQPAPQEEPAASSESTTVGALLAQQLRYDLGEALARELDRATEAFAASIGQMEARLAAAEAELAELRASAKREKDARKAAEERLRAFKELALK